MARNVLIVALVAGVVDAASAQTVPDAGTLLRDDRPAPPADVPPHAPALLLPNTPSVPRSTGPKIKVNTFRLEGVTLLPTDDLQAVLAPWRGRELSLADLTGAAEAVAEAYWQRGWLARPQVPTQTVRDGVVLIRVVEARLGRVRIEPVKGLTVHVDEARIVRILTARQQIGQPIRLDDLERAVNLLGDTPGLGATVALAPGAQDGETDLLVVLRGGGDKASGRLQADNHGSRFTGRARLGAGASLDDLDGAGGRLRLNTLLSEGLRQLGADYGRPLGVDGWHLGLSASAMHYRLVHEFAALHARGEAVTAGLGLDYPLVRSNLHGLRVSVRLERRIYGNEADAVPRSTKAATEASFGLGGDSAWPEGDGFSWWDVRLQASRLASAASEARPHHLRVGWSLGHLQPLGSRWSASLNLTGQHAGAPLDSSEKMSLGGLGGVRAYPSLEASGDKGWVGNAELRFRAWPSLQLAAFYDEGRVRDLSTMAPSLALRGWGGGLAWQLHGAVLLKAEWARRCGSNPAASPLTGLDGDGTLERTRFWVSLATSF